MKTALVTSKVTFINGNYQLFIEELLNRRLIDHLIILDNSNSSHLLKGLALMGAGALHTGKNLFLNELFKSRHHKKRENIALKNNVQFHQFSTVNSDEFYQFIKDQSIDLIINSRTRYIYKKKILKAPKIGCINIHHGLLPEQRGTLCDLQSLYMKKEAGFTIHEMTSKLDDGKILSRNIVASAHEFKSFPDYQKKSMTLEAHACAHAIEKIATFKSLYGSDNKSDNITYYKTPSLKEIQKMKKDIIL